MGYLHEAFLRTFPPKNSLFILLLTATMAGNLHLSQGKVVVGENGACRALVVEAHTYLVQVGVHGPQLVRGKR